MSKNIIYLVNSLDFFISHRIKIADELLNKNYKISILAEYDKEYLNLKNFNLFKINFRKSKFNIFYNIKNFFIFLNILRSSDKNSIIHAITIKPIVYLIFSSYLIKQKNFVISFSGLGYFFINKNLLTFIFKNIFFWVFKIFLISKKPVIIFQNIDDLNYFQKKCNNLINNYKIIKGSGINLSEINFHHQVINKSINFTLISRLLIDKGILEFINASNSIISDYDNVTFTLIGDIDKNNPKSVDLNIINNWKNKTNKIYLGYKKNIIDYIIKSNVIILPSYREGMPKILLEASAVGRPIITTNVPGCKECVINNLNGYLIRSKNTKDLTQSIKKFLDDKSLLKKMGRESNKIAIRNYSIDKVIEDHIKIYESK